MSSHDTPQFQGILAALLGFVVTVLTAVLKWWRPGNSAKLDEIIMRMDGHKVDMAVMAETVEQTAKKVDRLSARVMDMGDRLARQEGETNARRKV